MVIASLNRFLCAEYGLERFEDVLKVPLDNIVAKELRSLPSLYTNPPFV